MFLLKQHALNYYYCCQQKVQRCMFYGGSALLAALYWHSLLGFSIASPVNCTVDTVPFFSPCRLIRNPVQLHARGTRSSGSGDGDGDGGDGTDVCRGGKQRTAPDQPSASGPSSVYGKQRMASLFDLLQELSVPPKPR